MKKYYLPENYPDTEKGARLYIKDIKASEKKKKEKKLIEKAVKLIINYRANDDTQPILEALNNDKDLFYTVKNWRDFVDAIGNEIHEEFKQREKRINTPKRSKKFSKNKGDKYEIEYFIPEAYETSAEGMRMWFSELIRNAHTDEKAKEELLLTTEAMEVIDDFHYHKNKIALHEAVKTNSKILEVETFKGFYNDVYGVGDRTYKPTKKYTLNRTEELRLRIIANVEFYENMGFSVYYGDNPNEPSACELASKEVGRSLGYIDKVFKKYRLDKKKNNSGNWSAHVRDGIASYHGQAIWILNGFRKPKQEEISQLEAIFLSLTKEERKKVVDFSRGCNARKAKLPTTQKELRKIKIRLNKNKDYDFIKSLQIKEISLKT